LLAGGAWCSRQTELLPASTS